MDPREANPSSPPALPGEGAEPGSEGRGEKGVLTHFTASGEAQMVDVGGKGITRRSALAEGWIRMQPATLDLILAGRHRKGDVLGIARVAGIMGAKRTADLVPLCHPLALTHIRLDLRPEVESSRVVCRARVETQGQTGVEMEALCAVQVALLTIYDMCKAVDRGMSIEEVHLVEKVGGRSGSWRRPDAIARTQTGPTAPMDSKVEEASRP